MKGSAGTTGSTANLNPNIAGIGVELTATDTLTFNRGSGTSTAKVIGEVWRYTGSAGGANEFIKRGTYAVTIANGSSSGSVAVSGIVNRNDCVPILNGWTTSETSRSDYESCCLDVHIDASGNLVVSRNNTGTGVSITAYVDVIEFTGSNWSVGHGVSTNHDTAAETVTLNTDSTGTGGSTFDTTDWGTAFIFGSMEGDSVETGLSDVYTLIYPHTDTDKVVFSSVEADGNARNDGEGHIHVVQNDDLIVNRASNTNLAEGNGTYGTASWPGGASTERNLNELALEWFVDTSGTGTAFGRGSLGARITAASGTIQHWVHRSGNTVRARYGVIDLSQLTSVSSITGTAAIDQDDNTIASAGTVAVAGDAGVTEDGNTTAAQGGVAISGSAALSQDDNTISAEADVAISGSASNTQDADTVSAAGSGQVTTTGDADITQADNTVSSGGAVAIDGSASVSSDDSSVSAAGSVSISGTGDNDQAGDTSTGAGSVSITGSSAITQESDSTASAGTVSISGAAANTQDDDSVASAAQNLITGSAALTQDSNTVNASSEGSTSGDADVQQDDNSVSSGGAVSISGSLSAAQDDNTAAAAGEVIFNEITGSASITQDDNTATAEGDVLLGGSLNESEDEDSLDSDADLQAVGSLSATQDDTTISAQAAARITGQASITQADDTAQGSGTVSDVAFTNIDLTGYVTFKVDSVGYIEPEIALTGYLSASFGFLGYISPEYNLTGHVTPQYDFTGYLE